MRSYERKQKWKEQGRKETLDKVRDRIEEKIIEVGLVEDKFTIKILRELLKSLEQKA